MQETRPDPIGPVKPTERGARKTESKKESWREAIDLAKRSGFAVYGNSLIDWQKREITKLDLQRKPTESVDWRAIAQGESFFVPRPGRIGASPNLLARYSKDGELEWAIRVRLPKNYPKECGQFYPRDIEVREKEMRMTAICADKLRVVISTKNRDLPPVKKSPKSLVGSSNQLEQARN